MYDFLSKDIQPVSNRTSELVSHVARKRIEWNGTLDSKSICLVQMEQKAISLFVPHLGKLWSRGESQNSRPLWCQLLSPGSQPRKGPPWFQGTYMVGTGGWCHLVFFTWAYERQAQLPHAEAGKLGSSTPMAQWGWTSPQRPQLPSGA